MIWPRYHSFTPFEFLVHKLPYFYSAAIKTVHYIHIRVCCIFSTFSKFKTFMYCFCKMILVYYRIDEGKDLRISFQAGCEFLVFNLFACLDVELWSRYRIIDFEYIHRRVHNCMFFLVTSKSNFALDSRLRNCFDIRYSLIIQYGAWPRMRRTCDVLLVKIKEELQAFQRDRQSKAKFHRTKSYRIFLPTVCLCLCVSFNSNMLFWISGLEVYRKFFTYGKYVLFAKQRSLRLSLLISKYWCP